MGHPSHRYIERHLNAFIQADFYRVRIEEDVEVRALLVTIRASSVRSRHPGSIPLHRLARLSLALLVTGVLVASALSADHATVVRVVDGDTIEIALADKTEKVRLKGH